MHRRAGAGDWLDDCRRSTCASANTSTRHCSTVCWCSKTTRWPRPWSVVRPRGCALAQCAQEQSNYPLTLVVGLENNLSLRCSYDRQAFSAAIIKQIGQQLRHLLLQMLEHGAQVPVEALQLLDDQQRQVAVQAWNGAPATFTPSQPLHLDRSPGGPRAASAGAGLRRRAVELCRAEPPGQPGRPCADRPRRRPGRAGGPGRAALAGDGGRPAGHPQGRWRLRAAGPGLPAGAPALHDRGQRPAVAARPGRPRAEPGAERAGAGPGRHTDDAGLAEVNPNVAVGLDNLAYVIYTSGSTGKPKGTLLPHRNVLRLFEATDGWFGFGPQDCWTLFHSYAFDFSVWELFGALLHGGRLVIVPQDVRRSPEAFYQLRAAGDRAQPDAVGVPPADAGGLCRRPAQRPATALRGIWRRGAGGRQPAPVVRALRRSCAATGQHVRHHRNHGARDLPSIVAG